MVLSKRERNIFIVALCFIGLLLINFVIIEPVSRHLAQTRSRKYDLSVEVASMRDLLDRRKDLESRWEMLLHNGLTADRSLAETTMWYALHDWSSECGFDLPDVTPQTSVTDQGVPEIIFMVAGRGSMQGIAQLLWRIEQAPMPVRIRSIQLGSTSSSGSEITLTMRLSVLYLNTNQSLFTTERSSI